MVARLASLALIAALFVGCASAELDAQAGKITFGTSVNMSTGALTGQAARFKVGQDVAYRAALSSVMSKGSIRLVGTLNGTKVIDSTNAVDADSWSLYMGTIPAAYLYEAGSFQFRVLDVGNNQLAAGSFTLVP